MMTHEGLLPNLTEDEFREFIMEVKMKMNQDEKNIDHTVTGGTLDQVNREFLDNIIYEPDQFKVPQI